jgi:hypothetical protein
MQKHVSVFGLHTPPSVTDPSTFRLRGRAARLAAKTAVASHHARHLKGVCGQGKASAEAAEIRQRHELLFSSVDSVHWEDAGHIWLTLVFPGQACCRGWSWSYFWACAPTWKVHAQVMIMSGWDGAHLTMTNVDARRGSVFVRNVIIDHSNCLSSQSSCQS